MKALPPAMSSVGSGLVLSKSHMQKAMDIPASQQTIDVSATPVSSPATPKQNLLPAPKTQPLLSAAAPPDYSKMSRAERARKDPVFRKKMIQQQIDDAHNQPKAGTVTELKDGGMDEGTTKKNIDKKLEKDFELDPKMKKAFSDALALPAKSAAVALIDLLEKIPAPSKEASKILNRNMSKVTNAFKLGAASQEVANDEEDNDKKKKKEGPPLWTVLLKKGLSAIMGKASGSAEGGGDQAQISGSSPQQKLLAGAGDPSHGKRAPYTGTADGIGLGDGSGRAMQPIKKRKGGLAKKLFGMTPMGMAFNAGNKIFQGAKGLAGKAAGSGLGKGLKGLAGKAFGMTPMGMGLKLGMKAFGGAKNLFAPKGDQVTNLTELTDKTIKENRASADAKTEKQIATAAGTGGAMGGEEGSAPPYQQEGGELAQPEINESPYFDLYNVTSQF